MNAGYLQFLYDEEKIGRQLRLQKQHAWDLEDSIAWTSKVDTNQYLVALDKHAFLFPGSSQEERLVISQMMGLIIAASIYEMEESLLRLKQQAWVDIKNRFPVGPEFDELGEQFFIEELKHSTCFKRYVQIFAESLGVERKELEEILPTVEKTKSEALLKLQLKCGGQSFWWIVAIVEQVFLDIYNGIRPFKKWMLMFQFFNFSKL